MKNSIDTFIAPPCHEQIDILFQDEHILLINKPSGLLSLSGKNPLNKDSVHFRLVQQFPSATMVHRLDFGTSGVMVLALDKAINSHLTKQFQNRAVAKVYESILCGNVLQDEGSINFPIAKDRPNFPLQKICFETGKLAVSHYKVVSRSLDNETTRVRFFPDTGRTHQLRIHSRELGHPVVGCDLYGTVASHSMANRLLLHALSVTFVHPISGERMSIQSSCPF